MSKSKNAAFTREIVAKAKVDRPLRRAMLKPMQSVVALSPCRQDVGNDGLFLGGFKTGPAGHRVNEVRPFGLVMCGYRGKDMTFDAARCEQDTAMF